MKEGTLASALEFGLTESEFQLIVDKMARTPNYLELAIFSVMWSEHCSYKSSKPYLRKFPTKSPAVIQGPGENAGVVDIGDDLAVVFKVESHNHPSAIEPYQGAATGVGGIIRDIFTMGARPILTLDPLFFGPTSDAHSRNLLDGVVRGIAGYGNCVGVPNLGGELHFDDCYKINPLVNVFCLGIAKHNEIKYARASEPGDVVMIIGAKTGRDGIHGATFASDELSDESEEKRSAVQVGDPFLEKLLIEATLELISEDAIEAVQDLGAAGLTSSSVEMCGRTGRGIILNMDSVPRRAENMTAYEFMLSESQERMLLMVKPENVEKIHEILTKWDLDSAVIGEVTDSGNITIVEKGETVCNIPVSYLTDSAPEYDLPTKRPDLESRMREPSGFVLPSWDHENLIKKMASSGEGCSKEWAYHQYDTTLLTNTVIPPSVGSGVIRIKNTNKAIAVTSDAKPKYCYLHPRHGGAQTVFEGARNLFATGAKPLAISDCLNFGNPNKPEVYYEFAECVKGMIEALEELNIPVISGNVSLYNESPEGAIKPTPVVCMVGIADKDKINPPSFQRTSDVVMLLGNTYSEFGGSLLYDILEGKTFGRPPAVRPEAEIALGDLLLDATDKGYLASASDLSEGGLAAVLIESVCESGIGCQISLKSKGSKLTEQLFSETAARALISVPPEKVLQMQELATKHEVPAEIIGVVGGNTLSLSGSFDIPVEELSNLYFNSLREKMDA